MIYFDDECDGVENVMIDQGVLVEAKRKCLVRRTRIVYDIDYVLEEVKYNI